MAPGKSKWFRFEVGDKAEECELCAFPFDRDDVVVSRGDALDLDAPIYCSTGCGVIAERKAGAVEYLAKKEALA